jgi:hypothetical protein
MAPCLQNTVLAENDYPWVAEEKDTSVFVKALVGFPAVIDLLGFSQLATFA